MFVIAVLAIVGITDLLFLFVFSILKTERHAQAQDVSVFFHIAIASVIALVVSCASFYRMLSLRTGGRQIAEEMGARLIVPSTTER